MIVGAAAIPSAPALVPGLTDAPTPDVAALQATIAGALAGQPDHDLAVLVGAATRPALHREAEVSLAGIGRADMAARYETAGAVIADLSKATGYPVCQGEQLPLGLAVLALLVGEGPFVPLGVPADAAFDTLASVGGAIAESVAGKPERVVVVVAGDLAAGLGERSPLYKVDGATDWDTRVVDTVDSGRLDALARLGPQEAERVGALGWAPLSVLHGVCRYTKIGMVVRHYSAPRGVGYLVAQGS